MDTSSADLQAQAAHLSATVRQQADLVARLLSEREEQERLLQQQQAELASGQRLLESQSSVLLGAADAHSPPASHASAGVMLLAAARHVAVSAEAAADDESRAALEAVAEQLQAAAAEEAAVARNVALAKRAWDTWARKYRVRTVQQRALGVVVTHARSALLRRACSLWRQRAAERARRAEADASEMQTKLVLVAGMWDRAARSVLSSAVERWRASAELARTEERAVLMRNGEWRARDVSARPSACRLFHTCDCTSLAAAPDRCRCSRAEFVRRWRERWARTNGEVNAHLLQRGFAAFVHNHKLHQQRRQLLALVARRLRTHLLTRAVTRWRLNAVRSTVDEATTANATLSQAHQSSRTQVAALHARLMEGFVASRRVLWRYRVFSAWRLLYIERRVRWFALAQSFHTLTTRRARRAAHRCVAREAHVCVHTCTLQLRRAVEADTTRTAYWWPGVRGRCLSKCATSGDRRSCGTSCGGSAPWRWRTRGKCGGSSVPASSSPRPEIPPSSARWRCWPRVGPASPALC
jgi:hypothetical protein